MAMLKVDRTQLIESIRVLDGMVKRKRQAKAILKFTDGVLSITIANTTVDVHAAGDWPGAAKIGAQMLFISIGSPPTADPVTLSVEGNRFLIERRSTLCEWVESKRRRLTTAH
jgi:hypothetical protein